LVQRYEVDKSSFIPVQEAPLRKNVADIFEKCGVPRADAELGADVLVAADLRGVDTHGVSNEARTYITQWTNGVSNPRPNVRVLRETPSTANIDSDTGLGVIVAPKAMEMAIEKAKKVGMGVVTIRNGRHLGMASYHAMMALEHDMLGMCLTATPPVVVPTWGAEPRFGTNPISFAAPADKEAPFVFDAATTLVAHNKLTVALRLGVDMLPGWTPEPDGTPVMEERPAPPIGPHGLCMSDLLPLGSTRELGSHKGYGLAAMVDVLSGILTGGGFGAKIGRPNFGHYVAAYSIEAFMDVADFKKEMDEWLQMLKNTPPAPGHERVLYAGLKESETEADRRANGIPLHPEVIEWFKGTCEELSVPFTMLE
jgi:LDH2 family malate/lactate/ureidoglycolate dehydrogenase